MFSEETFFALDAVFIFSSTFHFISFYLNRGPIQQNNLTRGPLQLKQSQAKYHSTKQYQPSFHLTSNLK